MADIEFVIKLDEEYIKQIDKIKFLIGGRADRSLQINVINAIKNGTPLPKGHGRLFILDEEKAKKYLTKFSFSLQDWISEVGISNATIKVIEADKGGE